MTIEPGSPRASLEQCREKPNVYTAREIEFLRSISGRIDQALTPAQIEWLTKLAAREEIDFETINRSALAVLQAICARWLPNGKVQGKEFVALNPTRSDGKPGSFRINLQTGMWADFAQSDARGGDPISLAAYLHCGGDQIEGALSLKRMLGA